MLCRKEHFVSASHHLQLLYFSYQKKYHLKLSCEKFVTQVPANSLVTLYTCSLILEQFCKANALMLPLKLFHRFDQLFLVIVIITC